MQASKIYINAYDVDQDSTSIIRTTQLTCVNTDVLENYQALNPVLYNLNITQMADAFNSSSTLYFEKYSLLSNYTLVVIVNSQSIEGTIEGARIGLFWRLP